MSRFVVGVDNSPAARCALSWAYGAAARQDAVLEVVTAFTPIMALSPFAGYLILQLDEARQFAHATQHHVLSEALADDALDARIERFVAPGDAPSVLVERSQHASLLVVGRRASRLRRLLGGSVSNQCANQAQCPVVIVRGPPHLTPRRYRASIRRLDRDLTRRATRSGAEVTA